MDQKPDNFTITENLTNGGEISFTVPAGVSVNPYIVGTLTGLKVGEYVLSGTGQFIVDFATAPLPEGRYISLLEEKDNPSRGIFLWEKFTVEIEGNPLTLVYEYTQEGGYDLSMHHILEGSMAHRKEISRAIVFFGKLRNFKQEQRGGRKGYKDSPLAERQFRDYLRFCGLGNSLDTEYCKKSRITPQTLNRRKKAWGLL